ETEQLASLEAVGLSKLYSNIGYASIEDYTFIFSPYLPGRVLIGEQELGEKKLTINEDIEKLSFVQRMAAASAIATQLYRVHNESLREDLPEQRAPRIHGDIKGSNFHLYIDPQGQVHIALLDFGTSQKITLRDGQPQPVEVDSFQ